LSLRRRRRPGASADDPAQSKLKIVGADRAKKVARAIVVSLSRAGRLGASTKELARETRYPLRTVQRAVARLRDSEEIVETPTGIALASTYWDLTADPAAVLGFQNLRFVVENWRADPPPPCRAARWKPSLQGDAGTAEECDLGWEGRRVRLFFHPTTGNLEVIVSARNPIRLEDAGRLGGWLDAMLGLGRGETARVTQIEVNADHYHVRLEENYLELRDFPRIARVLYQKAQALRHENRLHQPEEDGRPLPLQRALEELVEGSPLARAERVLRLEIERETKEIERLRLAQAAPKEAAPERRDPGRVDPAEAAREGFG
jgi:hypothetical protein